jgi:hypothetical protein
MEKLVEHLPDDIKHRIFYDYLEIPMFYDIIYRKWEKIQTPEQAISHMDLLLPIILRKPNLYAYLKERDFGFYRTACYHITLHQKSYPNKSFDESFLMSWFMYYHKYWL